MNYNKYIFCATLLLIILISIYKKRTVEHFGMFEIFFNPGKWVGQQVGGIVDGVWQPMRQPMTFARDIFYNVAPNYTMVNRYLEKKNDWVRANKGMPLMNPIGGSVSFKFDDKRDDVTKRYAANIGNDTRSNTVGASIMNKIF